MKKILFIIFGLVVSISQSFADNKPQLYGFSISMKDQLSEIDKIKDLGGTTVRFDVPWAYIETKKGTYKVPDFMDQLVEKALSAGMTPLLILDYDNALYNKGKPLDRASINGFSEYAKFVVTHYKGKIYYYDVWNEWDATTGGMELGRAEDYVNLIKVVYPKIKSVDKDVQVLSGGISNWGLTHNFINAFLNADGLKYIDGISIHPYTWNNPGSNKSAQDSLAWIDTIEAQVTRKNGGSFPVYITEIGWPTFNAGNGVNEDLQAKYVSDFISGTKKRPYIKGVWWYGFKDQGISKTDKEQNFGIYDYNLNPKKSVKVFKLMLPSNPAN